MIISLVGCIALWILVVAFANMNAEIARIEKDVTELKEKGSAEQTIKTYTNNANKFSFQYPPDWYINDNIKNDGMLLLGPDASFANGAPIQMSVQSSSQAKKSMEMMDTSDAVSDEMVSLGMTTAKYVTYQGDDGKSGAQAYFIDLGTKKYLVITIAKGASLDDPAQLVLETLLKTVTVQN